MKSIQNNKKKISQKLILAIGRNWHTKKHGISQKETRYARIRFAMCTDIFMHIV